MGLMDFITTNVPKVDLRNYSMRIIGKSGHGKTPMYAQFANAWAKETNNNMYAVVIPLEDRYKHINIQTIKPQGKRVCENLKDVLDMVELLVNEKKNNKDCLVHRVCIDTTTKLEAMIYEQVVLNWQNETGKKESFNKVYGSYGGGYTEAVRITKEQILNPLRNVGYIVDTTTQGKTKSQKHPLTMEEYQIYSIDGAESWDSKCFQHDADISFWLSEDGKIDGVNTESGEPIKTVRFKDSNFFKGTKSPFVPKVNAIAVDKFSDFVKYYMKMFKDEMSEKVGITNEDEFNDIAQKQNAEIDNLTDVRIKQELEKDEVSKEEKYRQDYCKFLKETIGSLNEEWNAYLMELYSSAGFSNIYEYILKGDIEKVKQLASGMNFTTK